MKIISLLFVALSGFIIFYFFKTPARTLDFSQEKFITINDTGVNFQATTISATVDSFLQEQKITLTEHDRIIPAKDELLFPGTNISIKRAVKITIAADGQKKDFFTLTDTVADAVIDSRVALGEDDLVKPKLTSSLQNNTQISITRVEVAEEKIEKTLDFKTIAEEDDKLGWRVKKIKQEGEKGIKEVKYRVVSHDGEEISRKVLEENILKEPVPEIAVQGTYVKIGKSHTGLGTWYAWKGGLFAASPWLPLGSYAKVTNKANGESVIVQINDRGPFGPNRIIDLDKVAFAKIASIGAGVIDVKVEPVLN